MSIRSPLTQFLTLLVGTLLVVAMANVAIGDPGRSSDDRAGRQHRDDHRRHHDDDFEARLRGGNEVPPVESDARGSAEFEVHGGEAGTALEYKVKWDDGTDMLAVAGAHLHCAPAGENGPVVAFLAGVVAGGLDGEVEFEATITDDNIVNTACGETMAELVDSMAAGTVYVNVHSAANPSGEIRGQVRAD